MPQRFEGRNLDDALTAAVRDLGVGRWQLTYNVLLEKRGFLGGVKRIVLEAEINEAAVQPAVAPVVAAVTSPASVSPAPPRAERSDRGAGGGRGRGGGSGGGGGRGAERNERGGRGGGRRRRDEGDAVQSGDFEQFVAVDVPEQGPESESAAAVRDWIEELLERARLDLVGRTEENETQIIVRLYGRDAGRVIDRHRELLDAVQVLANKALVGVQVEKDIEVDCQQFKERRVEELGQKAREAAGLVRRPGRQQLLSAMSPIERRIVHMTLHDDPEETTEAPDEGFFKRVAIVPRSAAEPSQEQTDSAS